MKRVLKGLGVLILAVLVVGGAFVGYQMNAFDKSMAKVWDIPAPNVTRSADPEVIARGKHLVDSICACSTKDCHGNDLGGGRTLEFGPLGSLTGANLTPAGIAAQYSDGELARLIIHGVKKDGHSLRFMPVEDFNWISDDEVAAVISYLRTVAPVTREQPAGYVGPLGKVLDRAGKFKMDVARHLDHGTRPTAPTPAPTPAYGAYVARLCTGCHGQTLAGGPIPGAPPKMAVPKNITPHETGIKDYTFDDFQKLIDTGVMKNGQALDKIMPVEALAKMNEVERQALWAYLRSIEAKPFGQR